MDELMETFCSRERDVTGSYMRGGLDIRCTASKQKLQGCTKNLLQFQQFCCEYFNDDLIRSADLKSDYFNDDLLRSTVFKSDGMVKEYLDKTINYKVVNPYAKVPMSFKSNPICNILKTSQSEKSLCDSISDLLDQTEFAQNYSMFNIMNWATVNKRYTNRNQFQSTNEHSIFDSLVQDIASRLSVLADSNDSIMETPKCSPEHFVNDRPSITLKEKCQFSVKSYEKLEAINRFQYEIFQQEINAIESGINVKLEQDIPLSVICDPNEMEKMESQIAINNVHSMTSPSVSTSRMKIPAVLSRFVSVCKAEEKSIGDKVNYTGQSLESTGNSRNIATTSTNTFDDDGGVVSNNSNNNGEHYHHEEHHINEKVSNKNKIITSFIAGGLAGAIAKTTIAPLDRTKINFQTSEKKFSPKKALEFIKKTYNNEGFRALWRGNSATMVRIVPYAAIQYTAHEQYKMLLKTDIRKKHLPPVRRALAGSMAGVSATSLTYPLDFARARMAVTAKSKYGNIVTVFTAVWKEEGWRIVMRGYTPTVIGSCIYSGISFFTYETLKKEHASYSKGVDPTPFTRWCFGACAGILGQCTSYPLDIVRRRMQTAGVTGHSLDYTTILGTARRVYQREGIKGGLYKGLSMNWIKGPVSAGISFMVFETVQRWLRKWPVFHINED
ncbi:S2542-like protein [Mya arenaria]|uniref:S2542-like protein n=1 Tax=Mya arenaria TaxID=6604 RepID=A0ABY7G628_MYAAR|nr:uncharacterized protein LOC128221067 isoform X1 [Mya arenaria]XP_052785465.1 uncharacterized protein LOC128221067 isoform X1 [Mya arenaria]WAR29885.1 S2542-like protein [Mya arenaria]